MKFTSKVLLFLLLFFVSNSVYALNDAWKDKILYFVLIDRFYDGNPSNNKSIDKSNIEDFHGGDIVGLIKKLDYLSELGVNGIWLSPFFTNRGEDFFGHKAYHGYWPYDFFTVDKRFGTEKELLLLRKKLNEKKFALLLDMVVNHMGYDAPFVKEHPDWFNPSKDITNWEDPDEIINGSIYGLPDFASQKLVVKAYFRQIARHWIHKLKPDGFRLDAVKHVPIEFWRDFNDSSHKSSNRPNHFMTLGEYLNGDPKNVVKIWKEGKFDTLFDFPLYYTIKEVFAQDGDCRKLAARLYLDRYYPDAGLLATLIDNHDLDRFLTSCNGDINKYKLALAFLLTTRGIPVLCYGDEVPLIGEHGTKAFNRGSMVFNTKSDMFKYTKELIELRKKNEALRRGYQCHIYSDKDVYVFARLTENQLVIAAFNNSDKAVNLDVDFPYEIQNNVFVLKSSLGANIDAVFLGGRLKTSLPAKNFAVFIPYSSEKFYSPVYKEYKDWLSNEKSRGMVTITVCMKIDYIPENAKVFLTGGCDELGNWDTVSKSIKMIKTGKNTYEAKVRMPIDKIFECKCFYKVGSNITWQNGDNWIFQAKKTGTEYLFIDWKTNN